MTLRTLRPHFLLLLVASALAWPALSPSPAAASVGASVGGGILRVTGDGAADHVRLQLKPGDTTTLQLDVDGDLDFDLDIPRSSFTKILVDTGGGDDTVRILQQFGVFTTAEETSILGGDGNDGLSGGGGREVLSGGAGNDGMSGGAGNDILLGGANDDRFSWFPGDGNDALEGEDGSDRLDFKGDAGNESVDLWANGGRLTLFRDIQNALVDANDVEKIDFDLDGGADTLNVNDLAGTDVTDVAASLGPIDGQRDTLALNGTNGSDRVKVTTTTVSTFPSADITGLAATAHYKEFNAAEDRLSVATLDGADQIVTDEAKARLLPMTVDAGSGADTIDGTSRGDDLDGGPGNDTLRGGGGDDSIDGHFDADTIVGGDGADTINGSFGDDAFVWNSGDDSDVVDGSFDSDRLQINGSGASDDFHVRANAPRTVVERLQPDTDSQDLVRVEKTEIRGAGGDDKITAEPGLAALTKLAFDGGDGADTLTGAEGAENLTGGAGKDALTGAAGADVFDCDQPGEVLDLEPVDLASGNCLTPPASEPTSTPAEPATSPAESPAPPTEPAAQPPESPSIPIGPSPAAAPALSRLAVSPKRITLGTALPKLVARPARRPLGTVNFSLSKAAKVELRFARVLRGGKLRQVKTKVALRAKAGVNRVRFTGRLSRKVRLAPGSYRLTAVAIDADGARSAAVARRFTALRPR